MQTLYFSSRVSPIRGAVQARIPELDGIRGMAIALVLLRHLYFGVIDAPPGSPLSYVQAAGRLSWSGVDLFFVLSGFLIGGILLDNRSADNYFKVFYTRRFFRIVPIYLLCVVAMFLLMRMVQSGALPRLAFLTSVKPTPWLPHLVFLQNFWMAARNSGGVLSITWSLAVEEQFYLTLPLVVRLLQSKHLFKFAGAVVLAAPLFRLVLFVMWPGHAWAGFALLPCRADSLMLGVLGALAMRNPRWRMRIENHRSVMLLLLAVLAAGLAALTRYSPDAFSFGMQTIGFTWIALFYLCFLLYALTYRQSRISTILRFCPLCGLGTIAYGVYLYQTFTTAILFGLFYSAWPRVSDLRSLSVSAGVVLLTVILARASWRYFEQPLMHIAHRTSYEFGATLKSKLLPFRQPQRSAT